MKEKNCFLLNDFNIVHTFDIENKNDESYDNLRILQTGTNWHDS